MIEEAQVYDLGIFAPSGAHERWCQIRQGPAVDGESARECDCGVEERVRSLAKAYSKAPLLKGLGEYLEIMKDTRTTLNDSTLMEAD